MNCPLPLLLAIALTLAAFSSCSYRVGSYENLLKGAPSSSAPRPGPDELSVTYLGVNGYLLQSGDTAILVDPFFSRVPMRNIVFKMPIAPSPDALAYGIEMGAVPNRIDAILITHSHFDHALDVPALQAQLGGKVIASETGALLCEAMKTKPRDLRPSKVGDVHQVGGATIRVLSAEHDLVLGKVPFDGKLAALPPRPATAQDWLLGTPLAFLVEMGGKEVYIESGGVLGYPPPVSGVDLAIVGTAVGDGKGRYAEAVGKLRARYVLPSHQDNFFLPLQSGFHFSVLSDFPRIKAIHEGESLPGQLILMDYFRTWKVE